MKKEIFAYGSPMGKIFCVFEGPHLIDVSLGIEEAIGNGLLARENTEGNKGEHFPVARRLSPVARAFFTELDAYFKGGLKKFRQKIRFVRGTAFEQRIWLALRDIPYGETRSYKWIAERAGSPKAVRAAGQALGKNPLPLILPCHRIIASDGAIGGFSSGVENKKWLLQHESKEAPPVK